jgi:hypothetical protein
MKIWKMTIIFNLSTPSDSWNTFSEYQFATTQAKGKQSRIASVTAVHNSALQLQRKGVFHRFKMALTTEADRLLL